MRLVGVGKCMLGNPGVDFYPEVAKVSGDCFLVRGTSEQHVVGRCASQKNTEALVQSRMWGD